MTIAIAVVAVATIELEQVAVAPAWYIQSSCTHLSQLHIYKSSSIFFFTLFHHQLLSLMIQI